MFSPKLFQYLVCLPVGHIAQLLAQYLPPFRPLVGLNGLAFHLLVADFDTAMSFEVIPMERTACNLLTGNHRLVGLDVGYDVLLGLGL
jgi:hypothetical protein